MYSLFSFILFFFGCTHGMWKFLGQGSNLCHSSDQGCCSDDVGYLTRCATGEFRVITFLYLYNIYNIYYIYIYIYIPPNYGFIGKCFLISEKMPHTVFLENLFS